MTQLFHRLHVAWLKSQLYYHRARNIWFRWQCYRLYRQNQRRWLRDQDQRAKIKGRIVRVGTCRLMPDGGYFLGFDWIICAGNGALVHRRDAKTGRCYFYGYTIKELADIAQAPAEWVDVQN